MRLIFALLLLATPASAEDFFQMLTGTYGEPFSPNVDCRTNPHKVAFTDGNTRARFEWTQEIISYNESRMRIGGYDVLGTNSVGILLALDGESRLTDQGLPVVWVMRPVVGLDGYCWGRTDWPEARCEYVNIRCPQEVPTS